MTEAEPAGRIRAYEDRDREAVRELFVRVNRELAPPHLRDLFEAYVELSLREEIDRIPSYYAPERGHGFWVAEGGEGLLGMFGLERVDGRTAELRRMYVAPGTRRRGLARAMLAYAERVCRDAGYARIVLGTSELQGAALALYRGAGYRLVGEEVATAATVKTAGGGLRRFRLEKWLATEG